MPLSPKKKAAYQKRLREKEKAARAAAVQQFKDAKAGDDLEVFARAWFEALRHATPDQLHAEFEALLREAPAGRATKATTELLGMVEAILRRSRERCKAQRARGKTACEAAFQHFEDAKAGDDLEVFARTWFEALRHATPGQLHAEFEALLREAPAGRATKALTELLAMLEGYMRRAAERVKRARCCEAAVQQFKDAKAGNDIEAFARAWFEALRHATPGQLRDEFTALLRKAPAGRATKATTELLGMVEAVLLRNADAWTEGKYREKEKAARAAAVQQFEDAKAGDDIEVFARAWFEALRHATPGQLRSEFEALLREAPDGRATEATTELLDMVAAVLRGNAERHYATRDAAFQQFEDAKAGDDIEVFAHAYFAALRHATMGQLRDEFTALLREAPAGRATKALTEWLDMVAAHLRLRAERENARNRAKFHRRLRAVVAEGKVLDVPTYINEKRAAVIASIDDKAARAHRRAAERGYRARFYVGITQDLVDREVARVNRRRDILDQLGDGAILLKGVQIFSESNRTLASLLEWASQVHLAKNNRRASIFQTFARGSCDREGLPVKGYLAIAYVPEDRPTSCPAPPINAEEIWTEKITVEGDRETPPAWSEGDLDLWLLRDAAEARRLGVRVNSTVYCISTRGRHVRCIYSTSLADLREGIVCSTDEVCDDVDEARALARQLQAEREDRYKDVPWTPFTPTEVLYTWGGGDDDEAPSPHDDDDDDAFGVAAPDADASDAPPRPAPPLPAPRPLARMRRLPISILPLRSNCRRAEPSRAYPFFWETRAAPSAVRLRPPPLAKMKRKGISLMPLGPPKRRRADAAELARAPPSWPAPLSVVLPPPPSRPLARMKRMGISLMPLSSKRQRVDARPSWS